MNNLLHYIVRRPVGVIMTFILVVLLAVIALVNTPVTLFPNTEIGKITVVFKNNSGNAEVFEDDVIHKFRNTFLQVTALKDISSTTKDSKAEIDLSFEYGTDMQYALLAVNEKIDRLLPNFPGLERPTVVRYNISDIPSLYLAISTNSTTSVAAISPFVEHILKNRLEQLDEVALVDITGLSQTYIKAEVDLNKLRSLGLRTEDLVEKINSSNLNIRSIEVKDGIFIKTLNFQQQTTTLRELNAVQVNVQGQRFSMGQFITLRPQTEKEGGYQYNRRDAISLALIKKPKSSHKRFEKKVIEVIEDIEEKYPEITITTTKNQSVFLNETINSLSISLILGLFFALISTLVFLRSIRHGILLTICVVVSLLISILLLYLFDISLNVISLSGLILGIGLMIDNSIVVIDNINQKFMELRDVELASVQGTSEVFAALITSGVTTSSIFFPLLFLSGIASFFFFDQALAISFSLLCSFLVSVFLLPTLFVRFFRNRAQFNTEHIAVLYLKGERFFEKRQWFFWSSIVVILMVGIYAGVSITKEKTPTIDSAELSLRINWNENINIEEGTRRFNQVLNHLDHYVVKSEIFIGSQDLAIKSRRKDNGKFEVYAEIEITEPGQIQQVISKINRFVGNNFTLASTEYYPNESILNAVLGDEQYDMQISTSNQRVYETVLDTLALHFPDLIYSTVGTITGLELELKHDNLFRHNIERSNLLKFIQLQLGLTPIHTIQQGNTSIPILLGKRIDITELYKKEYETKDGNTVPLKYLIELKQISKPEAIKAIGGGERKHIINIKTNEGEQLSTELKQLLPYPDASELDFTGKYIEVEKIQQELFFILIVIIGLLYFILSIQFNSLKTPLIILTEIPICIAVALIALYFTNCSLNVMSFIGILMMCGVIINDSILKIDLINKMISLGHSVELATRKAGTRRLSSIIMTSLTTILALLPMFLQNDLSSQLQIPLVMPLISGLLVGTILSIFVIPKFYKILNQ